MEKGESERSREESEGREEAPGLVMSDLLSMSEPQAGLLRWLVREKQASLTSICAFLKNDYAVSRAIVSELQAKGFITEYEENGVKYLRVRLAPMRGRERTAGLWQKVEGKTEK